MIGLHDRIDLPSETMDTDDYDRYRRRIMWKMPSGLYVIGARDRDRYNGMALNWATQVASEPKLIGIGVERDAYTHELIKAGGVFSLNIVDRADRALVRKFVKPVAVDLAAGTLNDIRFTVAKTGAPILDQAVAYLDCRVVNDVETGTHTFFIGEVVDSGFLKDEETEVLRIEDTRMNYGG